MEVEQFMDECINVLRLRGHNAVSTRYLKSVILDSRLGELDACTTQVCMSQLVRLVGTRFLIHGSLYLDSSMMYVVNVKVIDVPKNSVVTILQDNFPKNPGITAVKTAEFTDKILNSVKAALNGTGRLPVVAASDSSVIENAAIKTSEVVVSAPETVEVIADTSDSVSGSSSEVNKTMIVDSLVDQPSENVSDTSAIHTLTDTVAADSSSMVVVISQEIDSGIAPDTSNVVLAVSAPPPVSLTIPLQEYQTSGPAAPPEALKRENVRKKLKVIRIATFGTIALAAFSGGIVINSSVKKGLEKEKTFFSDYMQADEKGADAAYQAYLQQTEKTDARMRQRSFLYTLSVLGLAGGIISFKF
jgi:hypothetical protein